MRNLRKFLALVLAMLMVSACAVSVSAAFTDQTAVDAHDYAAAIEELYDYGVIAGKEDANGNVAFDPEGSLARDEAAVIAAKLIAGSTQTFDWTAATTCRFTDVTAKWSFGYIEYAADRGVLDGIGGGKYNPKGTLDIASAVAIIVKALGLRNDVLLRDSIAKPSVWYLNWIEVAEEAGVLEGINPFSYTQTCTRAMMAQLASNALASNEGNNKLAQGFPNQKSTVEGMITSVTADVVKVEWTDEDTDEAKSVDFNTAAFNAALDGVTAKDLVNCKVEVKYNPTTNKITDVEVLTSTLALDYKNGKLAIVKESNKNTNKITLDGATYEVVATATESDSNNVGAGIGGGTTTTNYITVTVDDDTLLNGTACTDLPTYYAGLAYDDNNDGVYDRVEIDIYTLATVEKIQWNGKVNNDNNKYTPIYGINYLDNTELADFVTYTKVGNNYHATHVSTLIGADLAVMDNETPVLVNVDYTEGTKDAAGDAVISFLGSAEKVSGVLSGYSASGKYVTIGATKYPFAADNSVTTPDNWALNQTVTAYVLDGKYICFASESISDVTVIVDRVTIDADGKAVIAGYDVGNSYAATTITVDGVVADKIYAMGAQQVRVDADDAESALKPVEIGRKENNDWTTYATLLEGGKYQLVKTADGIYIDTSVLVDTDYEQTTNWTMVNEWVLPLDASHPEGEWPKWNQWGFERVGVCVSKVDANYIYSTGNDNAAHTPVAMYWNNNAAVVIVNDATDEKDPYSQTYTFSKTIDLGDTTGYAFIYNSEFNDVPGIYDTDVMPEGGVASNYKPHKCNADHKNAPCDYFTWAKKDLRNTTVSLVVFTDGIPQTAAEQTTLAANTGIAQIVAAVETAYATTKYNAIDLFTGTEIELVSEEANLADLAEGETPKFYDYNTTDNTVIGESLWVGRFDVTNTTTTTGVITTSKLEALPVKLVEQTAGTGNYVAVQGGGDKALTFTNVVVYKTNEAGEISIKDGKAETLKTTDIEDGENLCYIMGDTLIVIK